MTTQQLELPYIFKRTIVPSGATMPRLVAMNRRPRFHQIAAGIAGWDQIVDAFNRASTIAAAGPAKANPPSISGTAQAIIAGEDPNVAVDNLRALTDAQARYETFRKVEDAALTEVSERATAWFAKHMSDFEDSLTATVGAIFDRAAREVSHLEGVFVPADLADHPLQAPHWAALVPLANELREIEWFAADVRLDYQRVPYEVGPLRDWPLVGLVDDYPTLWPNFFMTSALPTADGDFPPERAPWADEDPTIQLRKLAELHPVARVRLGKHYGEHLDSLAERAQREREAFQEQKRKEMLRRKYGE